MPTKKKLQSGVVVNKDRNMATIYQNYSPVDSFPVITGTASNYEGKHLGDMAYYDKNPQFRNTPAGTYNLSPVDDIYGYKGFDMGNPNTKYIKVHQTYPGEFAKRNPTYASQDPRSRDLSYGCVNCRKQDIDKLYKYFPQGDTMQVLPRTRAEVAKQETPVYGQPHSSGLYQGEEEFKNGGIMKRVRISETPMQYGGAAYTPPTRKVRISAAPTMSMGGSTYVPGGPGGYGNQQKGHGYALDRFWSSPAGYPGATSQVQPFARVGNTLPEAEDGGDINAEKQEQVLGDFDQDGGLELMNVNGPSHAEGGKDVNVPSNSFVFSDTKDLKIKDADILAYFGLKPKRGGYTPAEIAKKYDLNKFKAVLNNPESDDFAMKTAQLMTDKYLEKLNKLAMIQETMKASMGMENSAEQFLQQQMQGQGQPQSGQGQQMMSRYGGARRMQDGGDPAVEDVNSPDEGGPVEKPRNYLLYGQPTYANPLFNDGTHAIPQYDFNPYTGNKGTTWSAEQMRDRFIQAGYDPATGEHPGEWYTRTHPNAAREIIEQHGKPTDWTPNNWLGKEYFGKRYEIPAEPGAIPVSGPNMLPAPVPGHQPMAMLPEQPITPASPQAKVPGVKPPKNKRERNGMNVGIDPNAYGNMMNLLQMAQLRKFQPYEAAPQAIIPDTVFMDPTRAIAAQQEMARGDDDTSPQGRANALARQGVAGAQAADTIGQVHNQNVQIANQANREAAAITNDLFNRQATRLAELNKANFLSDRDYQREMGRLQAEFTDRMQKQHDTKVKTAWLNKTSPYFDIDPVTQMPVFKSKAAEAKFNQMYSGSGTGSGGGGDLSSYRSYYAQALKSGMTEAQARDYAWNESGAGKHKSETYKGYNTMPASTKVSGDYSRYGGAAPHYDFGGPFLNMAAGPDLNISPDALPATYGAQEPASPIQRDSPMPVQASGKGNSPLRRKKGEDIATATNNPGNMKYASWMENLGGVPSGIAGQDGGEFAAFPDFQTGLAAYKEQLFGDTDGIFKSAYYKPHTTVDKALKTWSNNGYGAEIYPEIKGKTLGQLSQAERDELVKRQIKRESNSTYKLLRERGLVQYGGSVLNKFIR